MSEGEIAEIRAQIADLEARIGAIEENFNKVHPWLLAIYNDMLNLQRAALAQMSGDKDEAAKLVTQVKSNYLLLSQATKDE